MNWRNKIIVSNFTDIFSKKKENISSNFKILQWTLSQF